MKKIVILLFAQLMVTGCPNRDPGSFGNVAVIDGTDAGTDAGMWECTDGLIGSWEFTYTETDWEVRGATRCGEKETALLNFEPHSRGFGWQPGSECVEDLRYSAGHACNAEGATRRWVCNTYDGEHGDLESQITLQVILTAENEAIGEHRVDAAYLNSAPGSTTECSSRYDVKASLQ